MGILDRRLEDERALGRKHAAQLRYGLHLGPGRPLLRRLADWLLRCLLRRRGSRRALLCLTNSGIHRPAAALQLQQLIAKDLDFRSEEHTSELQSLMRISYAVFCLKKKKKLT